MHINEIVKKSGVVLMVSIALAIQPGKYALAIAATTEVKNLQAETVNHNFTKQAVTGSGISFVLLPGIGDSDTNLGSGSILDSTVGTNNTSGSISTTTSARLWPYEPTSGPSPSGKSYYYKISNYFNGSALLNTTSSLSGATSYTPYSDWKTQGINAQATSLNDNVLYPVSKMSSPNLVLIGHSMGGLRARAVAQSLAYSGSDKLLAVVTVGTPNLGAPIVVNGKPAAAFLTATTTIALSFLVPGALKLLGPALNLSIGQVSKIIDTPSGQDMIPNSAFLSSINNPQNSSFHTMYPNTIRAYMSGGDNDADHYISDLAGKTNIISNSAKTASIVAAMAWGASWIFGISISAAIAFTALAAMLWALPAFWKQYVVGSQEGDSIVPLSSQPFPAVAGGRDVGLNRHDPNAHHTGSGGEINSLLISNIVQGIYQSRH